VDCIKTKLYSAYVVAIKLGVLCECIQQHLRQQVNTCQL